MDPEGSLSCSQEPTTGPYPEPDEFSPHHCILILLRSFLVFSSHLRLGLSTYFFPSAFPTRNLYAFLFSFMHRCYKVDDQILIACGRL
jgi:hypothetical protein